MDTFLSCNNDDMEPQCVQDSEFPPIHSALDGYLITDPEGNPVRVFRVGADASDGLPK